MNFSRLFTKLVPLGTEVTPFVNKRIFGVKFPMTFFGLCVSILMILCDGNGQDMTLLYGKAALARTLGK